MTGNSISRNLNLYSFSKIDKDKDKNITIEELKALDKNCNGSLDDKEISNLGIKNNKDTKLIKDDYKNNILEPNKVVFSSNKLNLTRLSQEQLTKYNSIKNSFKDSPKLLEKFHDLLRKYNDSNSIDRVINRTLYKLNKVNNVKNIEFSKNEFEGHKFGLDDANKIVQMTNEKIQRVPDKISITSEPINKITSSIKLLANRHYSGIGAFRSLVMGNVEHIANYAERDKIGNCLENACLTASIAKDFKGIKNIEIYAMSDISIGHAFVVINRDKESSESDMSTWGKDAIVLDSWSGIVFRAVDFPSNIEGKKHPEFPNGTIYLELYQNEF